MIDEQTEQDGRDATLIRDAASGIVDWLYGYTLEFSSDRDGHRYDYELAADIIYDELKSVFEERDLYRDAIIKHRDQVEASGCDPDLYETWEHLLWSVLPTESDQHG